MNLNPKIAILLCTHNGEEYLVEQLNSIVEQSYSNYIIVIWDDASSDSTPDLISKFAKTYPEKTHIVSNHNNNLGARGSFSFLIEYVLKNKDILDLEDAYMMFCDQDDIWLKNKVEELVNTIINAEESANEVRFPVLVHSDLIVVSEKNQNISESFINYQGLEIKRNRFANMVISNLVTGCTAMINESLARKAIPIPKHAIMHDWWLALVAAAFGKVIFLTKPLVRYRQHSNNAIGAKEFVKSSPNARSFWRNLFGMKGNEHLYEVAKQAKYFQRRFKSELGFKENLGLRISSCMSVRIGIVQRFFYRIARWF